MVLTPFTLVTTSKRFFERMNIPESRCLDALPLKLQNEQLGKHVVELQETLAFQNTSHQVDPMPPPLCPLRHPSEHCFVRGQCAMVACP